MSNIDRYGSQDTLDSILDRVEGIAPNIMLTTSTSSPLMVRTSLANFYTGATQKLVSSRELKAYDNMDMAFFDPSSLLINPPLGYREFLNYAGYNDHLAECRLIGYRVFKTKNNSVWVPEVRDCKPKSPYGKYRTGCNSASRLVNNIDEFCYQNNDTKFIRVTLTVPKHTSLELAKNPKSGVKQIEAAFRNWIDLLEDYYGGELGVSYNVHIWSTGTLTPHFHVHATILCLRLNDNKFSEMDPFMPLDVLESFRAKWGSCCKRANLDYDPDDVDNYHWDYIKNDDGESINRPVLLHWLKYSTRSPLVDVSSYYSDHEFDDSQYEESWAKTLCTYINRRKYLGYLRRLNHYIDKKAVPKKKEFSPFDGSPAREVKVVSAEEHAAAISSGSMLLIEWDHKLKKYRVWIPAGFVDRIQPKVSEDQDKKLHDLMELYLAGKLSRQLYDIMIHQVLGFNESQGEI